MACGASLSSMDGLSDSGCTPIHQAELHWFHELLFCRSAKFLRPPKLTFDCLYAFQLLGVPAAAVHVG